MTGWKPAAPVDPGLALPAALHDQSASDALRFDWAGQTARHIGIVTHRWLQAIGEQGADLWSSGRLNSQKPALRAALAAMGTDPLQIGFAVDRVLEALNGTLSDERGQWILSAAHLEARSEYALSRSLNGRRERFAIDRTFIDSDGYRWIIDFKTGGHEGADLEPFLDRETDRYRAQLENYAALFSQLDHRPVRLGLYFPLLKAWREWAPRS